MKIKRAIVYNKGALFLDVLRKELGEKKFWTGLRAYTQKYSGQSVESRDFQEAMEKSAKRPLTSLFNEWVYGI